MISPGLLKLPDVVGLMAFRGIPKKQQLYRHSIDCLMDLHLAVHFVTCTIPIPVTYLYACTCTCISIYVYIYTYMYCIFDSMSSKYLNVFIDFSTTHLHLKKHDTYIKHMYIYIICVLFLHSYVYLNIHVYIYICICVHKLFSLDSTKPMGLDGCKARLHVMKNESLMQKEHNAMGSQYQSNGMHPR